MLIGLSGYATSGKDEVAKILVAKGYQRRAFADGVRRFLEEQDPDIGGNVTVPLTAEIHQFGWDRIKGSSDVRELLQRTGMAGRKVLGEDVWVEQLFHEFAAPIPPPDGHRWMLPAMPDLVIPDVRFENEAAAIKDRGGVLWRVTRPGVGPVNDHESETAMDGWAFDGWLLNGGTLEDLGREVDDALNALTS